MSCFALEDLKPRNIPKFKVCLKWKQVLNILRFKNHMKYNTQRMCRHYYTLHHTKTEQYFCIQLQFSISNQKIKPVREGRRHENGILSLYLMSPALALSFTGTHPLLWCTLSQTTLETESTISPVKQLCCLWAQFN